MSNLATCRLREGPPVRAQIRLPVRGSPQHLAGDTSKILSSSATPLHIVFCNSRRMAERLANKLNELPVRSWCGHHARSPESSVSRSRRRSSRATAGHRRHQLARLGIDMGAVDWSSRSSRPPASPRPPASRSGGHQVGEPSRGVIFPNVPRDLLEAAGWSRHGCTRRDRRDEAAAQPVDVLAHRNRGDDRT